MATPLLHALPDGPLPTPFDRSPTPEAHFRVHFFAAVCELADFIAAVAPGFRDRHQFLEAYLAEAARALPLEAWDGRLAASVERWEQEVEHVLPLRAVARTLRLSLPERLPLLLAGLVEEDFRFGTLFADLQAPLKCRRPTLELLGRVTAHAGADPANALDALIDGGYLVVGDEDAPRSERPAAVPEVLWKVLRGLPPAPGSGLAIHGPDAFVPIAELIASPALLRRLARVAPLLQAGPSRVVVVRGPEGADRIGVAGALARCPSCDSTWRPARAPRSPSCAATTDRLAC